MPMKNVLVIDDNLEFREAICESLSDSYEVFEAACPHDAFEILQKDNMDVIVCDLHMPFITGERSQEFLQSFEVGIKTIAELRWVYPELPIIAVSAAPYSALVKITKEISSIPILTKPFALRTLRAVLSEALDTSTPTVAM